MYAKILSGTAMFDPAIILERQEKMKR